MAQPLIVQDIDGSSRYVVSSFQGTGQNSFFKPPSQPQELFQKLENIMPTLDGTLNRRWGYDFFQNGFTAPVRHMYEYQKDSNGQRNLLLTSTSQIVALNESGTIYNSNVFTPSANAGTPHIITSRDFAYILDKIVADLKKWNGGDGTQSTGISNWGIVGPLNTGNVVGPYLSLAFAGLQTGSEGSVAKIAGTGINDITNGVAIANYAWTNPNKITKVDGAVATFTTLSGFLGTSQILSATNFGFNIPTTAKVVGIKVTLFGTTVSGNNPTISAYSLYKKNTFSGLGTSNQFALVSGNYVAGSSTDLWGGVWSPTDINDPGFGVAIIAQGALSTPPPIKRGSGGL